MFTILTLMENTAPTDCLAAEHGLSLLIEGGGRRVLYDTGGSPRFMQNAGALGAGLLGLDALNFANEGKLVIAVAREAAPRVLEHLRSHPLGQNAAIIGDVVECAGVRSVGLYGVKRTLDLPHAEPLPRIC